jgi:osmoprotectant transport system permease protein
VVPVLLVTAGLAAACGAMDSLPTIRVGTLRDVEGRVLGELFSQVIERAGEARVDRRFALGGTGIVLAALNAGNVDVVPAYSGTLAETVLRRKGLSDFETIRDGMRAMGYDVGPPLGFNNTYGIGFRRSVAAAQGLSRVSDLQGSPWRGAVTPEFADAPSGLAAMTAAYGLSLGPVRVMEHALSYVALSSGDVDFVDVYTTDAAIAAQDLVVLEDDKAVFVRYEGLALGRPGFAARYPASWAALETLGGRLSDRTMADLNRQFEIERREPEAIAAAFLGSSAPAALADSGWRRWTRLTLEHTFLVAISLAAALLIGLPLGVWAAYRPALAKSMLSVAGVVQTIPGVALLCFFIPLLGIGWKPAVYALALYALLPVVQGAITGLQQVDQRLREVASVLGMGAWEQRRRVELPIAAPAIVAGIRVAAVTNVGTAALAALVGAGGYGTLIVTGLAINDWRVVLEGALPSAALAMLLHAVFTALESRVARWRGE